MRLGLRHALNRVLPFGIQNEAIRNAVDNSTVPGEYSLALLVLSRSMICPARSAASSLGVCTLGLETMSPVFLSREIPFTPNELPAHGAGDELGTRFDEQM
jgi:hypothetical protein